ncbi:hypothetical protein [Desulfoscipio gibsoniae]
MAPVDKQLRVSDIIVYTAKNDKLLAKARQRKAYGSGELSQPPSGGSEHPRGPNKIHGGFYLKQLKKSAFRGSCQRLRETKEHGPAKNGIMIL